MTKKRHETEVVQPSNLTNEVHSKLDSLAGSVRTLTGINPDAFSIKRNKRGEIKVTWKGMLIIPAR